MMSGRGRAVVDSLKLHRGGDSRPRRRQVKELPRKSRGRLGVNWAVAQFEGKTANGTTTVNRACRRDSNEFRCPGGSTTLAARDRFDGFDRLAARDALGSCQWDCLDRAKNPGADNLGAAQFLMFRVE